MRDHASRPHHFPNKTSPATTKRCIRLLLCEGPVQRPHLSGTASATVHRILADAHLHQLSHVDRTTREPARRYEHNYPGSDDSTST
ncbi:hypothetical protein JDV76_08645 [Corynebacterium sp. CCM 8864]|uniref:Uncharacterized protein n=1 Tax=Corynebacterium marambiense TaxID=2765364 RepID=A0ABS0VW75_9CORY|nr:hypothetical protein [Corynebacterium marambiense]